MYVYWCRGVPIPRGIRRRVYFGGFYLSCLWRGCGTSGPHLCRIVPIIIGPYRALRKHARVEPLGHPLPAMGVHNIFAPAARLLFACGDIWPNFSALPDGAWEAWGVYGEGWGKLSQWMQGAKKRFAPAARLPPACGDIWPTVSAFPVPDRRCVGVLGGSGDGG